jgi:hypothetical protein
MEKEAWKLMKVRQSGDGVGDWQGMRMNGCLSRRSQKKNGVAKGTRVNK